ncbi:hypothetical protein [Ramlibacter alkalitolerans]|nr:hypothetical protein [Ramlibacter alkalitolerans]
MSKINDLRSQFLNAKDAFLYRENLRRRTNASFRHAKQNQPW